MPTSHKMTELLAEINLGLGSSLTEEDMGNAVNDRIAELTAELNEIVNCYPEHIRPHEAGQVFDAAIAYGNLSADCAGDKCLIDASATVAADKGEGAEWVAHLSAPAIGSIILTLPITAAGDPEAALDRHLAVDVADTIGPDWAQALYRFAVLVTKLA